MGATSAHQQDEAFCRFRKARCSCPAFVHQHVNAVPFATTIPGCWVPRPWQRSLVLVYKNWSGPCPLLRAHPRSTQPTSRHRKAVKNKWLSGSQLRLLQHLLLRSRMPRLCNPVMAVRGSLNRCALAICSLCARTNVDFCRVSCASCSRPTP